MKFEDKQNLIDDVIENEFDHEGCKELERMNEEKRRELKEFENIIGETIGFLREKLSKDDFKKIILLQDTLSKREVLKNSFYFNRGVRIAFTNLSFLKKYCDCF